MTYSTNIYIDKISIYITSVGLTLAHPIKKKKKKWGLKPPYPTPQTLAVGLPFWT